MFLEIKFSRLKVKNTKYYYLFLALKPKTISVLIIMIKVTDWKLACARPGCRKPWQTWKEHAICMLGLTLGLRHGNTATVL